jgi:hypothetical protein
VFEKSQKESELTKLRRDSSLSSLRNQLRWRSYKTEVEEQRFPHRGRESATWNLSRRTSTITTLLRDRAYRRFAWVELIGWPKTARGRESRHRENHAHGVSHCD